MNNHEESSDIIHQRKVDGVWVEEIIPFSEIDIKPKRKPKKKKKKKRAKAKSFHKKSKKLKRKSNPFYRSHEWAKARYQALKKSNGKCELCGRSPADGITLNVDHIKPRHKYPKLALDPDNLQVLCSSCNWGKYGNDETDWRKKEEGIGWLDHEKEWSGLTVIK